MLKRFITNVIDGIRIIRDLKNDNVDFQEFYKKWNSNNEAYVDELPCSKNGGYSYELFLIEAKKRRQSNKKYRYLSKLLRKQKRYWSYQDKDKKFTTHIDLDRLKNVFYDEVDLGKK